MSKLTNQMPNQDLSIAINSILTSFCIIYYNFQFVFKLIGLLIIGIIAYKIGKLSVSESISKKVKQVQKNIKQLDEQKQQLPTKIKNIKIMYMKFILLFVLLAVGAGVLLFTQHIKIDVSYIGILCVVPIVFYIIRVIHVSKLSSKNRVFTEKQKQIQEQVKQINKELGPKVQSILKHNLCRDKISSHQNIPSQICTKKDCQHLREALKQRYEVIRNLAESALQFQWCSTCKTRKPFDELVKFQAKAMPVRDGDISEEQDADIKINYLIQTIDQISKWIQDAGPCNCSKLYMEQILKNRRISNKLIKQLNATIQMQKQKQKQASNATINRTEAKPSNTSNYPNIITASQLSKNPKLLFPGAKKNQ